MSTVTAAFALTRFPARSTAVNVTFVVPTGKVVGASLTTATLPSTMSLAVAVLRKPAIWGSLESTPGAPWEEMVRSAGTVRTGGVPSPTTTSKVFEDLLPCESAVVQVT